MPKQQETPVCNRDVIEIPLPIRLEQLESAAAALSRAARNAGFAAREVDAAIEYGRKLAGAGVRL